jgi:uncharacterized protein YeaO (DUF488 family)
MIKLKRVYEKPSRDDGVRILVERLWPRGLKKGEVAADLWLKEVAPSPELRQWFGHDPARWQEFRRRYLEELRKNPKPVELLKEKSQEGTITLIFAAHDEAHNGAVVLQEFLEGHKG